MSTVLDVPSRSLVSAPVGRRSRGVGSARLAVSSRVYLPACSIVAVAAVLVGIGWANHWGGANFAGSVTNLRVIVVGPLTLAIIGVFLIVERLRPAQRRPLIARGHRHDLLFTLLNATLVVPLITALSLSFSDVVHKTLPWLVLARIGTVPRWGAIAVIFEAMDGLNWLAHLANHRVRMLWRFHELHHSQEDMSVLTVFRTHPFIHVSYLIALIPGIVLLANGGLSTTLLVIYGATVAFAHSNTNLGFGPLERIFVSPNFHRIHHKVDGPQDVNLGFALTIWDQLFRRAVFPTPETIRTDTGLPGRPLIVEQASARSHHFSVFVAQLVAPFRPMHGPTNLPSIREGTRRPGEQSDPVALECRPPGSLVAPGSVRERVVV
jgi:sterol desaturase/sphingolipid hydroxylase (fatty acid hydroxylase superfamily)